MQNSPSRADCALAAGFPAAESKSRPSKFHNRFLVLIAALAALLFCLVPQAAHAQFRASLRGVITDPTGAVIPGATVTLTNPATNQTRTTTSDGFGVYTFNALPPAHFRLTVKHPGFQAKVLSDVVIIPEQLNALNVTMAVGAATQTVTVSGVTRALDTDTATLSATITSNMIQHMPSFNRDIFQLAELTPGVTGDGSQGSGGGSYNLPGNQGPGGSGAGSGGIFTTENGPQIQNRGGQYETNGITIDGISTSSAVWGGTTVITPSEDSVESMKVVSSAYDASNGRFSGAQIEVTTKSGTNQIHGSAFFKASRPGLDAYQRWNGTGSNNPGTGATAAERAASRGVNRDQQRFNQWGGSLGGPLWKNKLFAFFNWETSPLDSVNTSQAWYETSQFDKSAAASGSIAAKYLSFPGGAPSSNAIIPRTCADIGLTQGVNCNEIPGEGLDVGSPLTTGLGHQDLTYGGSNNIPGVGGGLDGVPDIAFFNTVAPVSTSQMQFNGRVDADITPKDHVFFTLYWVPVSNTFYNGPARAMNLWHHSQVNDAFTLEWNHIFSPTMINEARVNAGGWRWNEIETNPQEPFGLPQDNINGIGGAGVQFFGAPGPSVFNQWTYTYRDVLTKVAGRHDIKMGGELTRLYYLNEAPYAARPQYNFDNLWDFANDAPYFESGQFDPATGIPTANRQDNRVNIWGFFVQDDWKVTSNLTINAGLRWSYFGAYYSKDGNLGTVQFGSGSNPLDGLNVRVGGSLYQPQKMNWGPQFGFAWQPTGFHNNLVVRGGFGINYNQNEIAILANGNGNPPSKVQVGFTCPYPYTNNPTCAGTNILYEVAGNVHSLFGFAPNPATITQFSPQNLPLTTPAFITGYPSKPGTIANYHYSLDVQYQLPYETVFSLGYQGGLTRHLLIQNNWLAIAAAHGLTLNPAVNTLDYYTNAGSGNDNAMIATLTHNFSHQFQAQMQYTWSKAMDTNSGPFTEDPYPFDTRAAYGRSDYNVQNAFKVFGMWQPAFFHGNGWKHKVVDGWTLSGIWNVHSGFPWTPEWNTVSQLYYQGSGYGSLRPASIVRGFGTSTSNSVFMQATNPDFKGNAAQFFTPPTYTVGADFPNTSPAPTPGMERNTMTGPGYRDVDATLSKAFGLPGNRILGEHAQIEFRVDAYNLFNKLNINTGSIDNNVGAVNPDGSIASTNSDFGVARNALGSRTLQLQTRFSF